jgi:hypothetical protein
MSAFSTQGRFNIELQATLRSVAYLTRFLRRRRLPSSCQSRFRRRILGFSPACWLTPAALSVRIPPTPGCRT